MVIFNVAPGGRDAYKIWEEGEVPRVIFEMTSASTKAIDQEFKKRLYAQLGVEEYWLFDPKEEWQQPALVGYRLVEEDYQPLPDLCSGALGLRLAVQDHLIAFYRLDTGEKLLMPGELATALNETQQALNQTQQALEVEKQRAAALEAQLAQYRDRFGTLS
ncbi:Uma2 family endonuclease [Trichothermofontia sichuanensis]|uniref:Uma2 family endonuclease n=1 Tax=Trichothermofontia sichuanensis TaxID=3045816 RepID=UPI00249DC006